MTAKGWNTETIGGIAVVLTGGTPSRRRSDYWGGGIPWMSSGEIHQRHVTHTRETITDAGLAGSNARWISKGAVMIALNGQGRTRGTVAILSARMTCNQSLAAIVPRHDVLAPEYLFHYLSAAYNRIRRLTGDGGRNGLNLAHLRSIEVMYPSLREQHKIVAILSSVDDAIEKTQAVIDQVQVVKRGLMQELLTRGLPGRHRRFKQTEIGEVPEAWDVVSLARSGATVTSGSRGWAKYYSDDGALFLRITNLARNTIRLRLNDVRHVAIPKGSTEGRRTRVQTGDLIISITADLGMVGFIPDGIGEAYVNQHLALVRLPDDALRPEFAGYFLATEIARNRFYRLNDAGAKAGLNLPTIMKLTVPKPPRDEQDMAVEVLTAIEERLAVEEKKLVGLAAVKSALMSVLLTGELRVTPDPEPA